MDAVDIEIQVRQDCYNRGYEKGKKDAAKEIYDFAKGFFTWDEEGFVRELKELVQDYGVEVE